MAAQYAHSGYDDDVSGLGLVTERTDAPGFNLPAHSTWVVVKQDHPFVQATWPAGLWEATEGDADGSSRVRTAMATFIGVFGPHLNILPSSRNPSRQEQAPLPGLALTNEKLEELVGELLGAGLAATAIKDLASPGAPRSR